jgi:hypothetical protein
MIRGVEGASLDEQVDFPQRDVAERGEQPLYSNLAAPQLPRKDHGALRAVPQHSPRVDSERAHLHARRPAALSARSRLSVEGGEGGRARAPATRPGARQSYPPPVLTGHAASPAPY